MEILELTGIKTRKTELGTRVDYQYNAPECVNALIKGEPLFVEFPCDMTDVPESILAIPFVGIMATVTMLLDVQLHVPVLDKTFYESIGSIGRVYQNVYPGSGLNLNVTADEIRDIKYIYARNTALFFTGGVDATSALHSLIDSKPVLLNIWGGDLRLTDNDSHIALDAYLRTLTGHLGLDYAFIKTNSRETFRENELGDLTAKHVGWRVSHGWWATIAHTLSMTATAIPWLWKQGIGTAHLGSSYTPNASSHDANNAELLHAIKGPACQIRMADVGLSRSEKVSNLIRWKQKQDVPLQLKVCWQRTAGQNCSACEKCYRTILNILSNHGDPNDFGFAVTGDTLLQIQHFLETNHVDVSFWADIQQTFLSERTFWQTIPEISWILDIKLNSLKSTFTVMKRRISSIIHKK